MATSGYHNPWMGSVIANGTVAQSVYALLSAIWSDLPQKAQWISIQLNNDAGATVLYIGNSDVSATETGVQLVATQAKEIPAGSSNLLYLKDIYLLASTGEVQVNLIVVVR